MFDLLKCPKTSRVRTCLSHGKWHYWSICDPEKKCDLYYLVLFREVWQYCLINFYTWLSKNDTNVSVWFSGIDWMKVLVRGHEMLCRGTGLMPFKYRIIFFSVLFIDFIHKSNAQKSTQNHLEILIVFWFRHKPFYVIYLLLFCYVVVSLLKHATHCNWLFDYNNEFNISIAL